MSEIKLETISSIHIGSGNFLTYNTDFVKQNQGDETYLYVIDDRKVLEVIGEKNLDNWVLSIERGENTSEFVKRCNPNIRVKDYATRNIQLLDTIHPGETLKECIHDGMGRAYIPGSSIKGAIRTAVLASNVDQRQHLTSQIVTLKGNRKIVSAQKVEEQLFGKMQDDVFRFLQVGDAIFKPNCEVGLRMNMGLNITQRQELNSKTDRKPQVIEAISLEEQTSFKMKIDERIFQNKHILPCLHNLTDLFLTVNLHTKKLVEAEIGFWQDYSEDHTGAEEYIKVLTRLLRKIEACKTNQCILRIGHGSGWDFITGAWTKSLNNFETDVVPAARPKNYHYEEYPFPKSRRLDAVSDVLGFVKLSFE